MLARVSSIETFRRWRLDEDQDIDDLISRLTSFQPTEAMIAGTAFHKALELAENGEYECIQADGYTFIMNDGDIALPRIRELRLFKRYGQLLVTGQVDALYGRRIEDHKTTAFFNAENYMAGCQWKFYLDIFGADTFRWNVFVVSPHKSKDKTYTVAAPQLLEQRSYPGMHAECVRLVADFQEFASKYLPQTEVSA